MQSQQQQLDALQARVDYLEALLHKAGILSDWKTPENAAQELGISAYTIREKIRRSRGSSKPELMLGKHWRYTVTGKRCEVNVVEWKKLQLIGQEYRQ